MCMAAVLKGMFSSQILIINSLAQGEVDGPLWLAGRERLVLHRYKIG